MEFSEKLQLLRKQRGWTQEQLAERIYVSRTAVSKWESGKGYPSIDSLKALAQVYEVTIDALLSGEELMTVAEGEVRMRKETTLALLDVAALALVLLPLYGKTIDGYIYSAMLGAAGCRFAGAPMLLVRGTGSCHHRPFGTSCPASGAMGARPTPETGGAYSECGGSSVFYCHRRALCRDLDVCAAFGKGHSFV